MPETKPLRKFFCQRDCKTKQDTSGALAEFPRSVPLQNERCPTSDETVVSLSATSSTGFADADRYPDASKGPPSQSEVHAEAAAQNTPCPGGRPASVPTTELLPLADSLAVFLVEPGVSYHAVREVRGGRARISLQGWLHAPSLETTLNFEHRGLATLQQILETRAVEGGEEEAGTRRRPSSSRFVGLGLGCQGEVGELSKEDLKVLSDWLAPTYLDAKQLEDGTGKQQAGDVRTRLCILSQCLAAQSQLRCYA
eukprot:g27941.t1